MLALALQSYRAVPMQLALAPQYDQFAVVLAVILISFQLLTLSFTVTSDGWPLMREKDRDPSYGARSV